MHKMNSFGISNQTCEKKKEKEKKKHDNMMVGREKSNCMRGHKGERVFSSQCRPYVRQ